MGYAEFRSSVMKYIGGASWDKFVARIASDIADLQAARDAQTQLADALLARGIQVIEILIEPIAQDAQEKDDAITAALNDATGAKQQILDILALLEGGGTSADLVAESATRKWLTATLKATYDGYAAQIAGKATPQDITDAIAALVAGAPTALDTLNEIATKLASDDDAIAAMTSSLSNRLRIDTSGQSLTTAQKANALTNLGFTGFAQSVVTLADAAALRTLAGLGTAAVLNVGTGANNVVQLDGSGHIPAVLLASTAEAQAGAEATKVMTAARVSEAIAALAKAGWEQIGATQTLSSSSAFVEQSWAAGLYREVICIMAASNNAGSGGDVSASLRNSSTALVTTGNSSTGLSPGSSTPLMVRSTISTVALYIQAISNGGGLSFNLATFTSAPDRMRIFSSSGGSPAGTFQAGSKFSFFGMR
ncbi:MAG: hypothetical protein K2W78_12780 [Xanthobacteraceae bacterium]|nr:hypothetical protein [Xanthobacteraceae bacterium]